MIAINYPEVKEDFVLWLNTKNYNRRYVRHCILSYLDRFVKPIGGPRDVLEVFSGLTAGQKHQLIRAVRALFNFLECQGFDKGWLDLLRKNIPKDELRGRVDLRIPSEDEVLDSLRRLNEALLKYQALYSLLLDSGLRVTEAVMLINKFDTVDVERFNGFCAATLGFFRGPKNVYYGFFTDFTARLIERLGGEKLVDKDASTYYRKVVKAVRPKYLRKFAFDKMIELEVPESVADFIQGRVPKTIGARHYMRLKRQATQFYPRYAEYITRLRQKALN